VVSKKFYQIDNMNDLKSTKAVTEKSYDNNVFLGKLLKSVIQKANAPKSKSRKKK
jgi:hypothetical protein